MWTTGHLKFHIRVNCVPKENLVGVHKTGWFNCFRLPYGVGNTELRVQFFISRFSGAHNGKVMSRWLHYRLVRLSSSSSQKVLLLIHLAGNVVQLTKSNKSTGWHFGGVGMGPSRWCRVIAEVVLGRETSNIRCVHKKRCSTDIFRTMARNNLDRMRTAKLFSLDSLTRRSNIYPSHALHFCFEWGSVGTLSYHTVTVIVLRWSHLGLFVSYINCTFRHPKETVEQHWMYVFINSIRSSSMTATN